MADKKVVEIAKRYANAVKALNPHSVVLYGSYVYGTPHEFSDIDIGVVFEDFKGDWLETSADLFGIASDIDDRLEPVLFDTEQDRSGFVKDILKRGIIIYSAEN